MLASLAYTSSLLLLAAICVGLGLGPIVNSRPMVFPVASLVTAILYISLWFFVLMALSGPLDAYGLFSGEAWSRILLVLMPVGIVLGLGWKRFGEAAKARYMEMLKGAAVFGASAETFRDALRSVFTAVDLDFIEQESSFFLSPQGPELKVKSLQQPKGLHIFYFEDPSLIEEQREIMEKLSGSFASTHRSIERRSCLTLAAIGAAMVFFGLTKG